MGSFKDGEPSGRGVRATHVGVSTLGEVYSGESLAGPPHGQGGVVQQVYSGEWQDGQPHGQGYACARGSWVGGEAGRFECEKGEVTGKWELGEVL